ncbi:MAG TPA: xanthine dehydrogenase family protein molybdopterin-binding subunit, partial [Polyangiaceae bacterium]|nr:xanthine dehydrogenase family protein molybdopterin-binding subunit [Polyangiaceae bacterium]
RHPGVLKVITTGNAPKLPGAKTKTNPNDRVLQLLQEEGVEYADQPVALVIADSLERAQEGAALVAISYDASDAKVDLAAAKGEGFAPKSLGPHGSTDSKRGDPDAALAAAAARVDQTYQTPTQTHNPMEMHGLTVVWQGADHVTLYDTTQGIFGVRKKIATVFGIPPENVRVISKYVGGGFGCKGSPWSHVALAAMAARSVGRPARLVLTRQQMFSLVGYRPHTIQHVVLGADRGGKLVAVKHEVWSETSRFDEFVEPCASVTRMLYACPNLQTSHRLVRLDVPTPTFMRAPGESSGTFALETAMDELAYELKIDPVELRLRNYAERDEEEGKPWSSKSLRECYRVAGQKFGWARRNANPRSLRQGRYLVGWGMASATYPARQSSASARARIRKDGKLLVQAGSQDIGTGTYTIMAQIAADELGIPYEQVEFELGDTSLPETPVSGGSQTASSTGSAVKRAVSALKSKLVALAVADANSPLHGSKPEDVQAANGTLSVRNQAQKRETYQALLARSAEPEISIEVKSEEKPERKQYSCHSFGAPFVEVRVDEELGEVRVTRVVAAYAAGKILNQKTARSQYLGGIVWGIGFALQEHTVRDARSGRVVTRDLADYHVPVHADVPDIDIIMVDEQDPYVNDIGAKGIGEIGITGVVAAIGNAVFHATGKRVRELPITLDKLI